MVFNYKEFLPEEVYNQICDLKVTKPQLIEAEAKLRKRRNNLIRDGKLILVASDHNARMITDYDGDPIRLGNRYEFISRILRVLSSEEIDGIEGTPDILEDLFILNYISKNKSGIDFLSNKLMIGTVNRGGLKTTCWEMDDMPTCFTVDRIAKLNLDGIKIMFRIDKDDEKSGRTIKYCADIVSESEKYGLPVFIEALYVDRTDNGYVLNTSTINQVKAIGVATALGNTSARKWIEVTINDDYRRVVLATTSPILVLPIEAEREKEAVVEEYRRGMNDGENVRGTLLGRNVFLSNEDPLLIANAIIYTWRRGFDTKTAIKEAEKNIPKKTLF